MSGPSSRHHERRAHHKQEKPQSPEEWYRSAPLSSQRSLGLEAQPVIPGSGYDAPTRRLKSRSERRPKTPEQKSYFSGSDNSNRLAASLEKLSMTKARTSPPSKEQKGKTPSSSKREKGKRIEESAPRKPVYGRPLSRSEIRAPKPQRPRAQSIAQDMERKANPPPLSRATSSARPRRRSATPDSYKRRGMVYDSDSCSGSCTDFEDV